MDLKNIHYLFAIEEHGSVSAAAQKLYLSQPTLSQFLKKYEDYLGAPIFARKKNGLFLTREGDIFLKTARNILQMEQDMKSRLAGMSETITGEITFALSAQRSLTLLPCVLPEFQQRYPFVSVHIVEKRTKELEYELLKGAIDLAILIPPLVNRDIFYEVFMQEEVVLAVPKSMDFQTPIHYTAGKMPWIDTADLKTLADYPFLLYDSNNRLHDFINHLFTRYEWHPKQTITFRNLMLTVRLTAAGMGITFIPETFADPAYELDYYSIGEDGCFRPLALAYPRTGFQPDSVKRFAEMLKDSLRKQQADFQAGTKV